jgi:hypothetical protein
MFTAPEAVTDLNPAVLVVADADHEAGLGTWTGGWWVALPVVMMIFMVLMLDRGPP